MPHFWKFLDFRIFPKRGKLSGNLRQNGQKFCLFRVSGNVRITGLKRKMRIRDHDFDSMRDLQRTLKTLSICMPLESERRIHDIWHNIYVYVRMCILYTSYTRTRIRIRTLVNKQTTPVKSTAMESWKRRTFVHKFV